jgi:hypothetical protein
MYFGLLGCVPGESSTQTLFLRVMDTLDDDDDESINQSINQYIFSFQLWKHVTFLLEKLCSFFQ